MSNNHPSAVIFGCAGLTLTDEEKEFFKRVDPLGFILFARNISNPEQLKKLVFSLRETVGRKDAPVLIDQEGGRVCRLKPPHWPKYPPARTFGDRYRENENDGVQGAYENARLIGRDLRELGIDVDCAPDLDVPAEGSIDTIIGDRTFSLKPDLNGLLGKVVCDGLLAEGVVPVIKHIPGHGRAVVDSHLELPTVMTDFETLKRTDFVPFGELADAPWAMTAHVLYTAIDPDRPASLSKTVIQDVIRGEIGFKGFLICDDLSMKALSGSFSDLTVQALEAGCDAVLHCNGNMDEMKRIASAVKPLSDEAMKRFVRGRKMAEKAREKAGTFDYAAAKTRLPEMA